ncbi:MAG: hypothetical protein AABW68_02645 [archaeon]
MRSRAQSSIEVIVILAVGLVILSSLVGFASQQLFILQEQRAVKTAEVSLERIAFSADEVYAQGSGSVRTIQIIWPEGLDTNASVIADHSIRIRTFNRTLIHSTIPIVVGSLPTRGGYHTLRIEAFDGFVTIGDVSLSAVPPSIFSSMDRDANTNHSLLIRNTGGDVNLSLTSEWDHSEIDMNFSPADVNVLADGNTTIDLNFWAGSDAAGAYAGKVWVRGTYADAVETLLIPLTASVTLGGSGSLSTYPSSIVTGTYRSDANTTIFQVCNTGDTALKEITFTPSSGNAGDWVQGMNSIPSLGAFSCTPVSLTIQPSSSVVVGTYTGSIFLSDYSGLHSLTLPLSVSVKGMNGIFSWDWSPASRSINAIEGFYLSNVGGIPIVIDQVKIRNWWDCDTAPAYLTQMRLDGDTLYSGSSPDGNWTDFPDVNLPTLTTWTDNSLTFSGDITDENETFIADVLFGDGTIYSSAIFGSGCADTTPPSAVSDLTASPGPSAQSVRLSFTYPGDDGAVGSVNSVIVKYTTKNDLSTENQFNAAPAFTFDGPFYPGGAAGNIVVEDLNIGYAYYFALKFLDENGNTSALSNNPSQHPWNAFQWSLGDFNFSNMPYSSPFFGAGDVNLFMLEDIQLDANASSFALGLRIVEDENSAHAWTTLLDFNATRLRRVRIWYPTSEEGIPSSTPQYDANKNSSFASGVNLLGASLINTIYRYNGSAVSMDVPNQFQLVYALNMVDFNVVIDKEDEGFIGG